MTPEEKDEFMESVQRIYETISGFAYAAEAILDEIADALQAIAENLATMISPVIDTVVGKLAKERSREASRRRPEPRAAKTRPPFRKRLKIFRCRNSC
jgi:predicted NBD/HSP70 family sugar kinase